MSLIGAACSGTVQVASPEPTPTEPSPASPEAPTPDARAPESPSSVAPNPSPTPFAVGDDEILLDDTDATRGMLANGLSYVIRRNEAPGGRAELRLVVNAGSAEEDPDQSGVAHFLEHMLFNGTEKYPSNELIGVLEGFGSEFGPDVNAYTTYDETVYELSVPTDDPALIEQAFDVLHEWAANATIEPAEVRAEIGVVVEEWRLRDQGISGRISQVYDELLTTGTPYEDRAPIGDVEAIEAMSADVLRRFYRDWYRPDLMAVVVVGDIDVAETEATVRTVFGDLEGPPAPRPKADRDLAANAELDVVVHADPELPSAYIEVIHAGPSPPRDTVGDLRRSLAYDLAATILDTRFSEDRSRGNVPYLDAYTSTTPLARGLATPGLLAEAPADRLEASLQLLLTEVARVRQDGFTPDELERAIAVLRSELQQAHAGRDTTQDAEYAAAHVASFLGEGPVVDWDDRLALETRLLDEMTAEYVAGLYLETLDAAPPDVVVVGPADDIGAFPSRATIEQLLADVPAAAPRVDTRDSIEQLMDRPDAATSTETSRNAALDAERLEFANGVTVWLKPTDIARNEVMLTGVSPGGLSVLPEEQLAAAFVAPGVITSSGVGVADQVELDRLLADEVVSLSFAPEQVDDVFSGSAATASAELLLQLVYQYLTVPRARGSALDVAVSELEPFAANPDQIPAVASANALARARFGDDRRFEFLPGTDELAQLTADDVLAVFDAMYGDAGDLTVAIVGDFDPEAMRDLAARYLGTLPGDSSPDDWIDHQPSPPSGVTDVTVRAGSDPLGRATLLLSADIAVDQAAEIRLEMLENILATRLRERLRERLGVTYAPVVVMEAVERPDALVETYIEASTAPELVDQVVAEITTTVAELRSGGLTDAEVATAREQVRRDLELVSNAFWTSQLLYAETHPGVAMLTVNQRVQAASAVGGADLEALAGDVLVDDVVVVKLLPG